MYDTKRVGVPFHEGELHGVAIYIPEEAWTKSQVTIFLEGTLQGDTEAVRCKIRHNHGGWFQIVRFDRFKSACSSSYPVT